MPRACPARSSLPQRTSRIDWVVAAVASTVIYAGVSISDKIILSRFGLRLATFNFFVGFSQFCVGVVILIVYPLPAVGVGTVVGGIAVGVLWGAGLLFLFAVLQREEVSRVVPVFQTYPIFVALMAVALLGEVIGPLKWLAILLAVGGAVLVSLRRAELGDGMRIRPGFLLLVVGAFLAASAQIVLKETSEDLSVWHSLALRGIGLALAMSLPTFRPRVFRELGRFFVTGKRGLLLFGAETVGAITGNVLLIYAIGKGPVSLASAILGTRPLFVFGASLALGFAAHGLLDERLDRPTVLLKLAAAFMVAGALTLIAVG